MQPNQPILKAEGLSFRYSSSSAALLFDRLSFVVLPLVGGVLMFLLAFIAVYLA